MRKVGLFALITALTSLIANFAKADTVVTSKTYVDAKISSSADISSTSTTTAPNEKAVYDAIAAVESSAGTNYQGKSTGISLGYDSGTWKPAVAGNYASVVYDSTLDSGNGAVTIGVDTTKVTSTYDTENGLIDTSTKLITEGVVAQALSSVVSDSTIYFTQNNVAVDSFTVNAVNSSTIALPVPNWDAADTAVGYITNKPTITNAASDITGAVSTDTKELPTTYAVQQYVDAKVSSSSSISDTSTTTAPNEKAVYDAINTVQSAVDTLASCTHTCADSTCDLITISCVNLAS